MIIRDEYEYRDVVDRLRVLRAEWDNYYINYERGNISYYEYNLITSELEKEMDVLEKAIDEWKRAGEPIKKKQRIIYKNEENN